MRIVVIDGQGGGIGRSLVERIRSELPDVQIVAVGTNSLATSAMLKAGANVGATGENAVICNVKHADVVAGPIGMMVAIPCGVKLPRQWRRQFLKALRKRC